MGVIEDKLKLLPDEPGVYVMLGKDGEIIYVGKAKVLKNRVRQYFNSSPKNEKTQKLVSNIHDFSYKSKQNWSVAYISSHVEQKRTLLFRLGERIVLDVTWWDVGSKINEIDMC